MRACYENKLTPSTQSTIVPYVEVSNKRHAELGRARHRAFYGKSYDIFPVAEKWADFPREDSVHNLRS